MTRFNFFVILTFGEDNLTNDNLGRGNKDDSRNFFGDFDLLFRAESGQEFVFSGNLITKKYKHKGIKGHFEIRFIADKEG